MEKKEFFELMEKNAKNLNIKLTGNQITQFYIYMKLLLDWNEKINLTAIIDPKEIIIKHFMDSITISKYIKENTTLVDVGTGAGFPGIPLKIIREDIEITLIDSLNKRIRFLEEVINKLELSRLKAFHCRVEEFAKSKEDREKFDYATSRAVANMSTLSEYLLPLVKIKGECICMKGSNIKEELEKSKKAISILGGKIKKIEEFVLPGTGIFRNIVIIEKEKNTPLKYPRKSGMPSKEPIT